MLNQEDVWYDVKAHLCSRLSFCAPAPFHFLDLGQCLSDSIISTMQLGFGTHNQTQKAFSSPIQAARFYLV